MWSSRAGAVAAADTMTFGSHTVLVCSCAAMLQATKLTGAAKTLCIPFNQAPLPAGTKCIVPGCEHDAVSWTLFGRSY